MRIVTIGLVTLMIAAVGGPLPAHAQYWQGKGSWCSVPPVGGGSWSCSYYSQQQCLASVSGGSRTCSPSPAAEWDRREGKTKGKSSNR